MASDITNIENINTISEGVQTGLSALAGKTANNYAKDKSALDQKINALNANINNLKSRLREADYGFNTLSQYGNFSFNKQQKAANASKYLNQVISNAESVVGNYGNTLVQRGNWVGYGISEDGYTYKVLVDQIGSLAQASGWIGSFREVLNGYISALTEQDGTSASLKSMQNAITAVPNVGNNGIPRGGAIKSFYNQLPAIITLAEKVESEKTTNETNQTQNTAGNVTLDTGKFTRERAVEALKNKKASETLGFGSV